MAQYVITKAIKIWNI